MTNAFEEDRDLALEPGKDSRLATPHDTPAIMETLADMLLAW